MVQLILDEQVEVRWKAEVEVVAQVRGVIPPGKADDLNGISLIPEVVDQLTVVQVTAADCIQRTVNEETEFHRLIEKAAQAMSFSHNTTLISLILGSPMRSLRVSARIRAKCSIEGFRPANSGLSLSMYSL